MSIGFQFTADIKQQNTTLEAIRQISEQFGYEFFSGKDWARVEFCRMGDLQFSFTEKKKGLFAKVELTCDACTSVAGAGFHAAAIDFVDALVNAAYLKIVMVDETEYYTHRDFEQMRREHFYSWLGTLVEVCARNEGEKSNLSLCWSVGQYLPEDIAGSVVTPFGRFNIHTMIELVQREGIEALARLFFLWNERERDAHFYCNCALSVLWEDCFFQPGSRSEADQRVNQAAIGLLEQAIKLDPSLPIPKAEYTLLCTLQERIPIDVSASPDLQSPYPIGYRRGMVVYRMGNTSLTLPGRFLMEENEDSTLWFDDQPENWYNLRASAFSMREGNAEFIPSLFEDTTEPMEEFDAGDGKGRGAFAGEQQDGDGECYYQSIAQIICQRQTTLITASYQNREDKAWAMALFRQIYTHMDKS